MARCICSDSRALRSRRNSLVLPGRMRVSRSTGVSCARAAGRRWLKIVVSRRIGENDSGVLGLTDDRADVFGDRQR